MFRGSVPLLTVVVVVALAGCLGTLASVDAGAASIPAAAYEREGYIAGNETSLPLSFPVGVTGVGGEVAVTSHVSGYSRTTPENETSALLVLTTPNARVGGVSVNPLRGATDPTLVRAGLEFVGEARTLGKAGNVTDLRELSSTDVELLGETAPMTTYAGVVDTATGRVDVRVHIAVVEYGEDVVLVLSAHPASMDERAAVGRMLAAAEHRAAR